MADEQLPQDPTLLQKGLQIPSRLGSVSSGFELPKVLVDAGVTKKCWCLFVRDIRSMARLDLGQHTVIAATGFVLTVFGGLILNVFIVPVAGVVGYKMGKEYEVQNVVKAYAFGATQRCTDRWNREYFEALGLHAHLEIPGGPSDSNMDVATTKVYKYQQKQRRSKTPVEGTKALSTAKEAKYRKREIAQQAKAARKVRIVVLPLALVPPESRALRPDTIQDHANTPIRDLLPAAESPQELSLEAPVSTLLLVDAELETDRIILFVEGLTRRISAIDISDCSTIVAEGQRTAQLQALGIAAIAVGDKAEQVPRKGAIGQ